MNLTLTALAAFLVIPSALAAAQTCTPVFTATITPNASELGVADIALGKTTGYDVTLFDANGNSIDGSTIPPACSPVTVALSSPAQQISFPGVGVSLTLRSTQLGIPISGAAVSSSDSDSSISVSGAGLTTKTKTLTVVSASLVINGTQGGTVDAGGQASAAGPNYKAITGGYGLGTVLVNGGPSGSNGCGIGIETKAVVSPHNYKGSVTLLRSLNLQKAYAGSSSERVVAKFDLSRPTLQTNVADASGAVYDFDAPGTGAALNTIYRVRDDFQVGLAFGTNAQWVSAITKGSSYFNSFLAVAAITPTTAIPLYFTRNSCTMPTASTYQFVTDVAGDNIKGTGCTALSADLSGSNSCTQ